MGEKTDSKQLAISEIVLKETLKIHRSISEMMTTALPIADWARQFIGPFSISDVDVMLG